MKRWTVGVVSAGLLIAQPVYAQHARPVLFELGVVEGVIARPYAMVGIVAAPLSIRVSGGAYTGGCSAFQVNVGRVLRDRENATHTVAAAWGRFQQRCWYQGPADSPLSGHYVGVMYDFQVKGFFIEVGPTLGTKNPFLSSGGSPLSHVYGQVGYVYRFGKNHEDEDED